MSVKLLDLPLLGETHKFRSTRESSHCYYGRWESGPLEGKEASPMKGSLDNLEREPKKKAPRAGGDAQGRRQKLLTALRLDNPLGLDNWARLNGFREREVRSDIGALRKAGHIIESVGDGRFALRGGTKVPDTAGREDLHPITHERGAQHGDEQKRAL